MRRGIAALLGLTVLAAACTSTPDNQQDAADGEQEPRGEEPQFNDLAMPEVASEQGEGGTTGLTWDAVDGAKAYRLGEGAAATQIPASWCEQGQCGITVDSSLLGMEGQLHVSAVAADQLPSQPQPADVHAPDVDHGAVYEPDEWEVVFLHPAEDPEGRPRIETLPADSRKGRGSNPRRCSRGRHR